MARPKKALDAKETPLQRQYAKIKERHPGAILLFRMGDFYETFDDDAVTVSGVLGITLTKRSNGGASETPLAGFPHHALDQHLPKLVAAGLRVAICEQLEDPKFARGIVKRDVVEVVTPGVLLRDGLLTPQRATYVVALRFEGERVGLGILDASTGEFLVSETPRDRLDDVLLAVSPAEVVVDKRQRELLPPRGLGYIVTHLDDWAFGQDFATEVLVRHFKTHSLKGFGVDDLALGLRAAGAVLHYVSETQRGSLPQVRRLVRYASEDYMALDPQTKRNLELVAGTSGTEEGSLVALLDETRTPMGARLLRRWLVRPLSKVTAIRKRQDAVEALVDDTRLREAVRSELRGVGDLERLAARLAAGRATPRDVAALGLTLRQIPTVKALLEGHACDTLRKIADGLSVCADAADRIARALVDEPPANLADGGALRDGFSEDLDELRSLARSGKDWVARLQITEAERTGIPSLKVGYNRVFGYYIEITHAHKAKIPDDYIRKQTLVGAERYVTPDLKEREEKILSAEEKALALEAQLFGELRMALADEGAAFAHNAQLLAMLDALAGFAEVAVRRDFVRPDVDDSRVLDIREGRHPVVEAALPPGEPFIPNSVRLDPDAEVIEGDARQIVIITGPNMAGKSVVLRQTGLIVLLAQIGSFVPAKAARIGLVDRIFTRVGASDNLAAGESTFLVEMNETANILHNATDRSLILLDEVGRGTSTYDGLSIAWALVEYLHETADVAARTLFATHYHELNALAERFAGIRNARVQVEEHDGRVFFLRRLVDGGADHSYGIEVATMAGLPAPMLARAREILRHLEAHAATVDEAGTDGAGGDGSTTKTPTPPTAPTDRAVPAPRRTDHAAAVAPAAFQASLFAPPDPRLERIEQALSVLEPDQMTPIEALLKLAELKRLLR
ncbi:MAG: DNA mismatch repair protein MutS [Bacteroidetes bacterium]|nr:DNA mismatch repair protein MutS [Bacteroidota bacterium]